MSQNVTVRYFAAAAEAAGADEERMILDGDATLDALRSELVKRYGAPMAKVLRGGSFLVGGEVRRDGGAIPASGAAEAAEARAEGIVVDVLPPFAGG